jgi:hypothetical protein
MHPSAIHTCSSSVTTTRLGCLSAARVVQSVGRICRPWVKRCSIFTCVLGAQAERCTQTSQYVAGCFYTDTSGLFHTIPGSAPPDEKEATVPTTTVHGVVDASAQSQWLVLVRPQGVLEVRMPYTFLLLFLHGLRTTSRRFGRCPSSALSSQPRSRTAGCIRSLLTRTTHLHSRFPRTRHALQRMWTWTRFWLLRLGTERSLHTYSYAPFNYNRKEVMMLIRTG